MQRLTIGSRPIHASRRRTAICIPYDSVQLECWLHSQLKVIDAWMGELLSSPESDPETARRLETHRQWLSQEIARLESDPAPFDAYVRLKV